MWGTFEHALSTIIYHKIACNSWSVHLSYLSLPLMSAKLSAKKKSSSTISFERQSRTLLHRVLLKEYLYNVMRYFNFASCFSLNEAKFSTWLVSEETAVLLWQTTKYQGTSGTFIKLLYVLSSFSEIRPCSRIFWDSRIEWHTRNARNSWRPRAARTTWKRWS